MVDETNMNLTPNFGQLLKGAAQAEKNVEKLKRLDPQGFEPRLQFCKLYLQVILEKIRSELANPNFASAFDQQQHEELLEKNDPQRLVHQTSLTSAKTRTEMETYLWKRGVYCVIEEFRKKLRSNSQEDKTNKKKLLGLFSDFLTLAIGLYAEFLSQLEQMQRSQNAATTGLEKGSSDKNNTNSNTESHNSSSQAPTTGEDHEVSDSEASDNEDLLEDEEESELLSGEQDAASSNSAQKQAPPAKKPRPAPLVWSETLKVTVHRIYIFLGDLWRYKKELPNKTQWRENASQFYQKALDIIPENGNSHNQLAVLSHQEFRAAYHYLCSLVSCQPFAAASENLKFLFEKNRVQYGNLVKPRSKTKNTSNANKIFHQRHTLQNLVEDFFVVFLRLHGILFTRTSFESFDSVHKNALSEFNSLMLKHPTALGEEKFTQMTIVNICSLLIFFAERDSLFFIAALRILKSFMYELIKYSQRSHTQTIEGRISGPLGLLFDFLTQNRELLLDPETGAVDLQIVEYLNQFLTVLINSKYVPESDSDGLPEENRYRGLRPFSQIYKCCPNSVLDKKTLVQKRITKVLRFAQFLSNQKHSVRGQEALLQLNEKIFLLTTKTPVIDDTASTTSTAHDSYNQSGHESPQHILSPQRPPHQQAYGKSFSSPALSPPKLDFFDFGLSPAHRSHNPVISPAISPLSYPHNHLHSPPSHLHNPHGHMHNHLHSPPTHLHNTQNHLHNPYSPQTQLHNPHHNIHSGQAHLPKGQSAPLRRHSAPLTDLLAGPEGSMFTVGNHHDHLRPSSAHYGKTDYFGPRKEGRENVHRLQEAANLHFHTLFGASPQAVNNEHSPFAALASSLATTAVITGPETKNSNRNPTCNSYSTNSNSYQSTNSSSSSPNSSTRNAPLHIFSANEAGPHFSSNIDPFLSTRAAPLSGSHPAQLVGTPPQNSTNPTPNIINNNNNNNNNNGQGSDHSNSQFSSSLFFGGQFASPPHRAPERPTQHVSPLAELNSVSSPLVAQRKPMLTPKRSPQKSQEPSFSFFGASPLFFGDEDEDD